MHPENNKNKFTIIHFLKSYATQLVWSVLTAIAFFVSKLVLEWTGLASHFESTSVLIHLLKSVQKHPFVWCIGILAFSWSSVLFIRGIVRVRSYTFEYKRNKLLVRSFGIESYWHTSNDDAEMAWIYCRNVISQNASLLRVLGCTGVETFVSNHSPLHKTLIEFQGAVQILLIHPESQYLEERARSLRVSVEQYRAEIKQSYEYLRELKETRNNRIEVRFYMCQPPIWKMIVGDTFLWLQFYKQGKHVAETPVYGFISKPETSLYHSFSYIFTKRWNESESYHCELFKFSN